MMCDRLNEVVEIKLGTLAMIMATIAAGHLGQGVEWAEENWLEFMPAAELIVDEIQSEIGSFDEGEHNE